MLGATSADHWGSRGTSKRQCSNAQWEHSRGGTQPGPCIPALLVPPLQAGAGNGTRTSERLPLTLRLELFLLPVLLDKGDEGVDRE